VIAEDKNARFRVPVKLYRVGELVRYTGLSRQTIHNYTMMGLIREAQWTQGGHRLYDESVFERLSKIIELKKTKTLYQIRESLGKENSEIKKNSDGQKSRIAGD
jgi:DNA-binding transcriptional MerR regulator